MRKVAIASYGNTKFSQEDLPIESLLLSSTKSLFDSTKNLDQKDIDVVLISTNDNSKYLSAILSELAGIQPKISHTVESLCNSGSNATVSAFSYIASGLADVALVVGADRYDSPGHILQWDKSRGEYKHPIFWASIFTKAHKRKFKTTDDDLAIVSARNQKNARDNPFAFSEKNYTFDEIKNSKRLTEDLRVSDCSKPCSGSSAILLASETVVKNFTDKPVWIKGIGQKTLSAGFTKTQSFDTMDSTKQAAQMVFSQKLTPETIDVAEVHDAFTVCELMAIEDLGLVKKGDAARYIRKLNDTHDRRINPRGGLLGSGHPLGATGVAQIGEITQQIKGEAGKKQVDDEPKTGLVHNMSAAATSSTVLILQS